MDVQSPTVDDKPVFGTNPNIFKLGASKQHVLAHEIGQGSQCRNRKDCSCEGLDLHFWRKLCKACGCRMDEHDVVLPHELDHAQIVIGRLFGAKEHFENNLRLTTPDQNEQQKESPRKGFETAVYSVQFSPGQRETEEVKYAWAPLNDKALVEKYMNCLPVKERPVIGTIGEQNRKSRLQYQLPLYDSNLEDARFIDPKDVETSRKFIENMKKNVIGVGEVTELSPEQRHSCKCPKCDSSFDRENVAISCKHGNEENTLHPNCLRCETCNQLLVDNIFFLNNGKYYCGRHYSDLLYPRCSGCDELIFAVEYTFAEDASWHFDHFACFKCDFKLGGSRYMTKENNPYCLDCYLNTFAKTCDTCKNKIGPDEKRLNYNDVHWHAKKDCFQCAHCTCDLIGKKFIMKNQNLFCSSTCRVDFNKKNGII